MTRSTAASDTHERQVVGGSVIAAFSKRSVVSQ